MNIMIELMSSFYDSVTMETTDDKTLAIDCLNDDILRLVFTRYVDLRTRLRSQLVCRRFNALIADMFDNKTTLLLSDSDLNVNAFSDEDFRHYTKLSLQELCQMKDGLWFRSPRGLRLLTPLEIVTYTLAKYKQLKTLCLTITNRSAMDSFWDQLVNICGDKLEKLIIINTNGQKIIIKESQMDAFCRKFQRLRHFEVYTDYLYTTEECFRQLMTRCLDLETFKLDVRFVFSETIEHLNSSNAQAISYNTFEFSGQCFCIPDLKLTTIDVSFAILSPQVIENIADDEWLKRVKHFGVKRVIPTTIKCISLNMSSLESLSFSMNDELTGVMIQQMLTFVGQLKALTKLSIDWNNNISVKLDEQILNGLKQCPIIDYFGIYNTKLREDSIEAIGHCIPNMQTLCLKNCRLDKKTFTTISDCRCLKKLIITDTFLNINCITHYVDINQEDKNLVAKLINKCVELDLFEETKQNNMNMFGVNLVPPVVNNNLINLHNIFHDEQEDDMIYEELLNNHHLQFVNDLFHSDSDNDDNDDDVNNLNVLILEP